MFTTRLTSRICLLIETKPMSVEAACRLNGFESTKRQGYLKATRRTRASIFAWRAWTAVQLTSAAELRPSVTAFGAFGVHRHFHYNDCRLRRTYQLTQSPVAPFALIRVPPAYRAVNNQGRPFNARRRRRHVLPPSRRVSRSSVVGCGSHSRRFRGQVQNGATTSAPEGRRRGHGGACDNLRGALSSHRSPRTRRSTRLRQASRPSPRHAQAAAGPPASQASPRGKAWKA